MKTFFKKILVGCTVTLFSYSISAQTNNLYFNQVILVGATTMTVPANKVWKIEGFLQNEHYAAAGGAGCGSTSVYHGFFVNGVLYGFPYYYGYYGNASSFPIWLPAGTTLRTECTNDRLSVIEFNVGP